MTYAQDERRPPTTLCGYCLQDVERPCGEISYYRCARSLARLDPAERAARFGGIPEAFEIKTASAAEIDAHMDRLPPFMPGAIIDSPRTIFETKEIRTKEREASPMLYQQITKIVSDAMNGARTNRGFDPSQTEGWQQVWRDAEAAILALVRERSTPPPADRDFYIWRDPVVTQEALRMERAAWQKADHERTMLRVRNAVLRQALIDVVIAAGGHAPPEVSDAFLSMAPDEVEAMRARLVNAEAETKELQEQIERVLFLAAAMRRALEEQMDVNEKLEADRHTPLTAKELNRAARLTGGWKGSALAEQFRLGAELLLRDIDYRSFEGATAAALAEIDRLRSVHGAMYGTYDEAYRNGLAMGLVRGHVEPPSDEEVYRSYAHSRAFRGKVVDHMAARLSGFDGLDDALANRKLTEQP